MSYLDQQKLQAARHRHRQCLFRSNRLAAYNAADLADPREIARREAIQAAMTRDAHTDRQNWPWPQ